MTSIRFWRAAFAALLLLGGVTTACAERSARTGQPARPLNVVATTTQIADMARNVAGDRAQVVSILPLNADPHEYEPTTDDARRVAGADLILQNGIGLEKFIADLAKNRRPTTPLVTVTDGVPVRESDAPGEAGGPDPHVWFAGPNAMQMARNIRDALSAVDGAGAATYDANAAAYLRQLEEMDRYIFDQIGRVPPEGRKLVTNHDAFGYYCDYYGLQFVGSVIPSLDTEAEPSAADVARLIQAIREQNVRAIFTENTLNPALAERIARETGVKSYTLYGDSLGPPGSGADTYIGMMRTDTDIIVNGLLGG